MPLSKIVSRKPLFNRRRQRLFKKRAACLNRETKQPFFLHQEVEFNFQERLKGIRYRPQKILILTPGGPQLSQALKGQGLGQENIVTVYSDISQIDPENIAEFSLISDEEFLPFKGPSFDLILYCLSLQRVNDVKKVIDDFRSFLLPGGLLMAAFYGGETLRELRTTLLEAELEITGGASPRIHPTITGEDAMRLMQNAGFLLPVVDRDQLTLLYSNLTTLFQDIRQAGENNSLHLKSLSPLSRTLLKRTEQKYYQNFSTSEGQLQTTVEIFYLTGWA